MRTRFWILVLLLLPSSVPAANVTITAPPARTVTAGLGFGIAATLWSSTSDSLLVNVSGLPPGLTARFVRVKADFGVASVSGLAPALKKPQTYDLTWTATRPGGPSEAQAHTTLTVTPPRNAGGNLKKKTRELLCKRYEYGVDAQEVMNLGAGAFPLATRILRDTTCVDSWSSAVDAEGVLAQPAALDSLHAFMWDRFTGDVETRPREIAKALFFAPVAMGMAAASRPDAVDSLIAWTNPTYWMRLPWRSGALFGRDLGIFISGRVMQGLSLVSDGRAAAALEALGDKPYDRAQLTFIQRALERHRKVLERGWPAVREEERLENQ